MISFVFVRGRAAPPRGAPVQECTPRIERKVSEPGICAKSLKSFINRLEDRSSRGWDLLTSGRSLGAFAKLLYKTLQGLTNWNG